MKRNKLLNVALVVTKAIQALIILVLVILVIAFVHIHFSKDDYKGVQISIQNGNLSMYESKGDNIETAPAPSYTSDKKVYLKDLNLFSFYFTFLQIVFSMALCFLIAQQVIRILKSVQEFQPFAEGNIKAFKRIGYYCLSIAIVNCFRFLITQNSSSITFSIDYFLLIFMLVVFVLAEIFREGLKLYEQDKLTI